MNGTTRILIIGGGFAGTATALNLESIYRRDPSVEITLIDSENFFTFTPLLAVILHPRDAKEVTVPEKSKE